MNEQVKQIRAHIEAIIKEMQDKGSQSPYHDAEIIRRATISTCTDLIAYIDALTNKNDI